MLTHENAFLYLVTGPPATQPFSSVSYNKVGMKVRQWWRHSHRY